MRPSLLSLLPLPACLAGLEVENPTGDCDATIDGSRACEHAPNPTDTYLPDCDAPLAAEYWRVFALDEAEAYVYPRPDGSPFLEAACAEGGPLRDTLDRYTLCDASPDIDLVNAMTPADALAITHDQHERLVFTAEGTTVSPWPHDDDLATLCASPDPGLADLCAGLPGPPDCPEIGIGFSEEEAALIAEGLNALYGITAAP